MLLKRKQLPFIQQCILVIGSISLLEIKQILFKCIGKKEINTNLNQHSLAVKCQSLALLHVMYCLKCTYS